MKTYKTFWCLPGDNDYPRFLTWGTFEDYIVFESLNTGYRFVMWQNEFEFLIRQTFANAFENQRSNYIQILSEWNECKGFDDVTEQPSVIQDIPDTITAFEVIGADADGDQDAFKQYDLLELIAFLRKFQAEGIKIYEE